MGVADSCDGGSSAAEPDAAEPDAVEPDIAEPDTAEPDIVGSDTQEPDSPETVETLVGLRHSTYLQCLDMIDAGDLGL